MNRHLWFLLKRDILQGIGLNIESHIRLCGQDLSTVLNSRVDVTILMESLFRK